MLSRADKIKSLSELIATDFFITMLNPAYRGKKFNFQSFDIANYVQSLIRMCIHKELNGEELSAARQYATATWDKWCKRVGRALPR